MRSGNSTWVMILAIRLSMVRDREQGQLIMPAWALWAYRGMRGTLLKAAAVLNSNSPGRGGRLQRQWQQVWLQLLRFMLQG